MTSAQGVTDTRTALLSYPLSVVLHEMMLNPPEHPQAVYGFPAPKVSVVGRRARSQLPRARPEQSSDDNFTFTARRPRTRLASLLLDRVARTRSRRAHELYSCRVRCALVPIICGRSEGRGGRERRAARGGACPPSLRRSASWRRDRPPWRRDRPPSSPRSWAPSTGPCSSSRRRSRASR